MFPDVPKIVRDAAARPEVLSAIGELYADVQKEIDLVRPKCFLSGRCCRFEEFGHSLFVTTLELAAFLHDLESAPPSVPAWTGKGCPFQVGKACGVHAFRPFGCRIFFCDAGTTDWQHEQYETFHRRLKRLHEELQTPYLYLEWRQALRTLGLA